MSSINGRELQHALVNLQATCSATGATFTFQYFSAVEIKDGAKKEAVRDKNGKQTGYVIKQQETDSKVTTLQSEWYRFRSWLRQQATAIAAQTQQPTGIGQVEFDVTCTFGNTIATRQTDRLGTVMVQEEAKKSTSDQNPLSVDIPLFVLEVSDENGIHFVEYGA